jgi:hypothetical protein
VGSPFHGNKLWVGRKIREMYNYETPLIYNITRVEEVNGSRYYVAELEDNKWNLSLTYWLSPEIPYPIRYKVDWASPYNISWKMHFIFQL